MSGSIPRKATLLSWLVGALCVAGATMTPAHAQATRTWVSGVGDDANPCSRTAPCKTWAGAISKTAAGGEIDNIDQGGFGTLTITKSITLDGGGGDIASSLASGTPGMTINAASNDVVILRNLQYNGMLGNGTTPNPGTNGISVVNAGAARIVIENCRIFGFSTTGVSITPSSGTINVKILKTTINNTSTGVLVSPTGGSTANVTIDATRIDNNVGGGLKVTGVTGTTENVAVSDSTISLNGGNGVNAVANNSTAKVDLEWVTLSSNVAAAVQSNGAGTTVTVGSSMLSNNGSAWSIVGSGALASYKNNQVTGAMGSTPTMASFQ
jgi:hypothetical protein